MQDFQSDVRRLSAGRWLIPLLAAMHSDGGSRFGVLSRRLRISRSVLSASLAALERFGWIERAKGHGHPLRPEYLLTEEGKALAGWCAQVVEQRRRVGVAGEAFRRWTIPLLLDLSGGSKGFSALQRSLVPVTPRALSMTLSDGLGQRLVEQGPGDPMYRLSSRGRDFTAPLLPQLFGI